MTGASGGGSLLRHLEDSLDDEWGQVSAGTYDTAVLVYADSLRPQLFPAAMTADATRFLRNTQLPDGSWGVAQAPAGYRLVPTLAATAALLAGRPDAGDDTLNRAMAFLATDATRFRPHRLPDTVAIEYLVPAWLQILLDLLDGDHRPAWVTDSARAGLRRLRALHTAGISTLTLLRRTTADAANAFPPQLIYTPEVLRAPPPALPELFVDGHTGCSPSATATALTWSPDAPAAAIDYLATAAARRDDGALPHFLPLTTFERSWIAANAARLPHSLPDAPVTARLRSYFADHLRGGAVGLGPGLPPNGDITATMLYAHAALGGTGDPACLLDFQTPRGFANHPDEESASTTVTAHVLEAVAACAPDRADPDVRAAGATAREHLLSAQSCDGWWTDKWHASPHYATACAATALTTAGDSAATAAVARANQWVLSTQRADGSWGQWGPTLDETAHAAHQLLATDAERRCVPALRPQVRTAVNRALTFLADARHATPDDAVRTPLWHSKELFEPGRILDALVSTVLEYRR